MLRAETEALKRCIGQSYGGNGGGRGEGWSTLDSLCGTLASGGPADSLYTRQRPLTRADTGACTMEVRIKDRVEYIHECERNGRQYDEKTMVRKAQGDVISVETKVGDRFQDVYTVISIDKCSYLS